jgi:hypothetical protein
MDDRRDHEEELFKIINEGVAHDGGGEDGGAEDGSKFLDDAGEGTEIEARDDVQTSDDCDDFSYNVGPLMKSSEVY